MVSPIQRGVPPASNHNPFVRIFGRIFYHIIHPFTFKEMQILNLRFSGFEAAESTGNNDNLCMNFCFITCCDDKRTIILFFDLFYTFPKCKSGRKRFYLLKLIIDKLLSCDAWVARYIIDWFVRIYFG
ncbi:hypothetical protein D3C71_766110 [compost metagenome]